MLFKRNNLSAQVLCWHHAVGKHRRSPGFRAAAPRRRLHRGYWLHHGLIGERKNKMSEAGGDENWNRSRGSKEKGSGVACFDVGVSLPLVYQAALQVGGHGERLHQCREVVLTTFKTVPVQVIPALTLIHCRIINRLKLKRIKLN